MKCRCGYNFAQNAVEEKRAFRSFAVIDDRDYKKLLESEIKIKNVNETESRLKAIAESSTLVGWLLECPRCKRVLLQVPGRTAIEGPICYEQVE